MVQRLTGLWKLLPDPENRGRLEAWFQSPQKGAVEAPVPGIVQQVFPDYHGVAWYWHAFRPELRAGKNSRCLLRFGAVHYLSEVWLNGIPVGGHEGGETPFTLDVTGSIRPAEDNLLAVRVLNLPGSAMDVKSEKKTDSDYWHTFLAVNPSNTPIDGMRLAETPSGNGRLYGGIIMPVELLLVPIVRIDNIFVQPKVATGDIDITVSVVNDAGTALNGKIIGSAGPANTGEVLVTADIRAEFLKGESTHRFTLTIKQYRLWSLDDPQLYRVALNLETYGEDKVPVKHGKSVRCGFRDFRVIDGYFHLNGKRVFLRSTHTAAWFPPGGPVADLTPAFPRRDLIFAKACGLNMVRFLAGAALPEQLDFCDEIGLMIYEESLASWGLADSPQMPERYDRSVREMILRDRNHPSIVIWGMLNETFDYPVFHHAVKALSLVRSLDETRLVLLNSGRIDRLPGIGSLSNPGSTEWEHQWGDEAPGAPVVPQTMPFPPGLHPWLNSRWPGDVHPYPGTPYEATVDAWSPVNTWYRTVGAGTKPIFLSEAGYGSVCNAIREFRHFEEAGMRPDLPLAATFRSIAEKFVADWKRFRMERVYPFPEDMLLDSQRLHCRQRRLGFDLIRSNPKICGFNITSMLDGPVGGEGLWTFWREWKPGIVDTLSDGWAPLRWCLFAGPLHGYAGQAFRFEAVLANEDVLAPGDYPVSFKIFGPEGVVWERKKKVHISSKNAFAIPVLSEEIAVSGPAGDYIFAAEMEKGGAPTGGRRSFYLTEQASFPKIKGSVVLWGIEERIEKWLKCQGIACRPFSQKVSQRAPEVILVGEPSGPAAGPEHWREMARRIAGGSIAVFLSPDAFKEGDDSVRRLPLANKGRCYEFGDWLYHKECVAKSHPVFDGLQCRGIMDPDYYGPVIARNLFDGQDTPDEVMAAAFAVGYTCPGNYASGILAGSYRFGAGSFIINTFRILEHFGHHPTADRLLLNFILYARKSLARTLETIPADFESRLRAIGYESK